MENPTISKHPKTEGAITGIIIGIVIGCAINPEAVSWAVVYILEHYFN